MFSLTLFPVFLLYNLPNFLSFCSPLPALLTIFFTTHPFSILCPAFTSKSFSYFLLLFIPFSFLLLDFFFLINSLLSSPSPSFSSSPHLPLSHHSHHSQLWQPAAVSCLSPAWRAVRATCFLVDPGVPPSPPPSAPPSSSTAPPSSPWLPAPWRRPPRPPWDWSAASAAAVVGVARGLPSPSLHRLVPATSWARPRVPKSPHLPVQVPPLSVPSAKPRRRPWVGPWPSDPRLTKASYQGRTRRRMRRKRSI